jgi:hypothetical protein
MRRIITKKHVLCQPSIRKRLENTDARSVSYRASACQISSAWSIPPRPQDKAPFGARRDAASGKKLEGKDREYVDEQCHYGGNSTNHDPASFHIQSSVLVYYNHSFRCSVYAQEPCQKICRVLPLVKILACRTAGTRNSAIFPELFPFVTVDALRCAGV